MKILFWIVSILLILLNMTLSFVFLLASAVGGYAGTFGVIYDVINFIGRFTVILGLIGFVFGILAYRKGNLKKAFICSMAATIFAFVLIGSLYVLDGVHTIKMNNDHDDYLVEMFGENWNAPSNFSEIDDNYEAILNMYYVAIKNEWTADQLNSTELYGMHTMIPYYGNNALKEIGFVVTDLNDDGIEEMVIGSANPNQPTTIFAIYYDPDNPHKLFSGVEDDVYYAHNGDNGLYLLEIYNENEISGHWVLLEASDEDLFDFSYAENTLDSMNRLTINLIPFAEYK